MGKLGPRLASRKRAKRWAKGQSSSSNPSITKHRELAARMFFKDLPGSTPGITKEDLRKHDAIQGIESQIAKLDIDDDQGESTVNDGTTVNTFDTFVSNCTNMSFNRFLSHFQSSSILHKEMLAVLAAITDVIQQKGGNETSTEYFIALLSILEVTKDDISVAAMVSLLGLSLRTVPKDVLNQRFGATSKVLLQICKNYAENLLILRHCIGCLSILLRAQEAAVWDEDSTKNVFNRNVLPYITCAKPKIRKSAQNAICAVLKDSDIMKGENPPTHHPAATLVAKHCIEKMKIEKVKEPGGVTTTLHVLTLLKDVVHQLPRLKTIWKRIKEIMKEDLENVLITTCCLQTLHSLFVSRPSEATLPSTINSEIIRELYEYQPPMNDAQPTLAWLAVMQEAHCNLAHTNLFVCAHKLSDILEKCISLWMSDKKEVIIGTSNAIQTILHECVAPLCENDQRIREYTGVLRQIISLMHKGLSCQYLDGWQPMIRLIPVLFQVTGRSQLEELVNIVRDLDKLRDSHNFAHSDAAEYAVGAAIKAMGPQTVLNALPLQTDGDTINLKRSWLIPLLKDCITHGSISFFTNVLLPIAQACEEKARKEPINGKVHEFLVPQIWSILPSICSNASDVKDNFQSVAQRLGKTISERKELRLPVLAALRKLIARATEIEDAADTAVLTRFAKNYLPILFNVYATKSCGTDEEGQRLAVLDTIKVYLTITSKELANELFDRALSNLDQPNADDIFRKSIYDLIRLLIGCTDIEKLEKYYDEVCVPLLEDNKQKEQKKGYRFLEEVCGSDKEVCKSFLQQRRHKIQDTLVSSATSVMQTSKGPRLKCLIHLVKLQPQPETEFVDAILPEAVLCIKDINKRCRDSAYELLQVITEKLLLSDPEQLQEYTNKLTVGIAGDDKYCSSTLLILASLMYRYNDFLSIETVKEILSHVCTILTSATREIVESALSFVKVYLSTISTSIVAPTLPQVINALSQMKENCKRHFRQKVRDVLVKLIRKYGIGPISDMVPATDRILHKRLKNINKTENAKRKNREIKRSKQLESDDDIEFKTRPKSIEEILADSDEEFEAAESEGPKKRKKRTSRKEIWIQENEKNIVDLMDSAATRNFTTTQPGLPDPKIPVKKVKDCGFKIASDGRLIIADDKERDCDVEDKKKTHFPQNDSEDDYKDKDDVSVATANITGRKRKFSDANSDAISFKSQSTSRYQAGGSGIHRPLKTKKIENVPGSEYRATKARGDIKKKGKPDPYAYLPLTRAALTKRKKKKNAGKIQSIFSGAKKGARIGMKNKRKKH